MTYLQLISTLSQSFGCDKMAADRLTKWRGLNLPYYLIGSLEVSSGKVLIRTAKERLTKTMTPFNSTVELWIAVYQVLQSVLDHRRGFSWPKFVLHQMGSYPINKTAPEVWSGYSLGKPPKWPPSWKWVKRRNRSGFNRPNFVKCLIKSEEMHETTQEVWSEYLLGKTPKMAATPEVSHSMGSKLY